MPERLRRARKAAGWSCSALSGAAGVGLSTVRMIEHGIRIPRLPMVEHLARALLLSPARLAFGAEDDFAPYGGLLCDDLAARLREARARIGVTVKDLGRRADVTEGAIRALERGGQPTIDTLEQLAVALDVSPAWLAFGQGEMVLVKRRRQGSQLVAASATH